MQKVEGEDLKYSSGSGGGNSFGDQMNDLEEQLKKAQETMANLLLLKEKLEAEKKLKQEQLKKEKEKADLQKLKEENSKLKDELNNYHDEIDSLKDVIASLKDDLTQSAEQFQAKFATSLKILEKAEAGVAKKAKIVAKLEEKTITADVSCDANTPKETNSQLNSSETLESVESEAVAPIVFETVDNLDKVATEEESTGDIKTEKDETKTQEATEIVAAVPVAENTVTENDIKTESTVTTTAPEQEHITDSTTATSAEPEKQSEEQSKEESKNPKDTNIATNETPVEENITVDTAIATATPEDLKTETESTEDEELGEYEKIKRELEALVTGNVIETTTETVPQKVVETPAVGDTTIEPVIDTVSIDTKDTSSETNDAIVADDIVEPKKTADQGKPKEKRFLFFFKAKTKQDKKEKAVKEIKPVENTPKNESPKKNETGKLLVKTAVFALIIGGGFIGYRINNAETLRKTYIAQAKNVYANNQPEEQLDTPSGYNKATPEQRYREAFADVPPESTLWDVYNDTIMGFKLSYPKNASNRLKSSENESVWFLRKEGYLMKIDRIKTDLPLDKYLLEFKTNISYKTEITTFKKLPAILLTQNENLPISGNIYLVKTTNNDLYKIWYKTFTPNENVVDEARVAKMLETFEFVSLDTKTK